MFCSPPSVLLIEQHLVICYKSLVKWLLLAFVGKRQNGRNQAVNLQSGTWCLEPISCVLQNDGYPSSYGM